MNEQNANGKPTATRDDGRVNLHESQGNKQVLANYAKAQAAIAAARQRAAIVAASQDDDATDRPVALSQSQSQEKNHQ